LESDSLTVQTAKDRYLFLFNDILVITKPLITSGINATLDMKFVVKSVVSLDKLHVHGFAEESTSVPERSAVIAEFIERFARDPHTACRILVERNRWKDDAANLASVIFKTAELDKTQIGVLLSENEPLMRAFIDLFHFTGVRIDDALRMFLLSLRLPGDPIAAERLLRGLAYRYSDANKGIVSFDRDLAAEVVLSIMQLDDSLHGGQFGFALRNPALRPDIFISALQGL
jgi:Sec7-like guanine-nucleotide exchange factor